MNTNWEPLGTGLRLGYHHFVSALMRARYLGRNRPIQTYLDALASRNKVMLKALARPMQTFTLVATRRLDPEDATHGTWNLVFEGQGRPDYAPGDMAYLSWRNPDHEVQALLDLYGEEGERRVVTTPYSSIYIPGRYETMTLREALTRRVDLHEASPRSLRRAGLDAIVKHNQAQDRLHHQFHKDTAEEGGLITTHPHLDYRQVHLPALLQTLGHRRPSLSRLVREQGRISARPYTMSGFQQIDPHRFRFEITVSQVEKTVYLGANEQTVLPARGSSFFARLKAGEVVEGWLLPEVHQFPSTLGRKTPLIVLCTGSGIGGLLSFLKSSGSSGDAPDPLWLIYGVRSWKTKHLYGPELESFLTTNRLERIDVATSRPLPGEGPARRVQALLWERRAEVAEWIRAGAHFYLSGRLSMGTEVAQTLERILVDQGLAADTAEAHRTLVQWHHELRFQASISGV